MNLDRWIFSDSRILPPKTCYFLSKVGSSPTGKIICHALLYIIRFIFINTGWMLSWNHDYWLSIYRLNLTKFELIVRSLTSTGIFWQAPKCKASYEVLFFSSIWFVLWIIPRILNSRSFKIPTFGWLALERNPGFLEKESFLHPLLYSIVEI